MSVRVGVVVLNWNGGAQTVACVESARAQLGREHCLVLVDNDSADAEREDLRRRYGADALVELCFLDHDGGYTGGMNAGINLALGRGVEMVLLVTHDAVLAPGALAALVGAATADPRIGIVGPKVVDAAHAGRILSLGERVHVPLLCVPRTLLRYRRPRRTVYEVSGVMGCVMLLTRRCIEAIGNFDEQLFMYYDEVDLCLRARRAGFKIACTPHAVALHDGMRGYLAGFTTSIAELKARNLIRLMRRWAKPAHWLLLLPTYVLLVAGSIVLYGIRGRFDVIAGLVRGTAAGLRGVGGIPASLAAEPVRVAGPRSRAC